MNLYELNETDLSKLLKSDSKDVSTDGTGLYSQTSKISLNPNEYTLMIGIGGTGWRALANIKRYMMNNVSNYGNNVAFLAIDADTTELDASILDPNREVIRVSANSTQADRELNIAANRSDNVKEWINPAYYVSHDERGANRIRQAGRGKLYTLNTANGQPNDQVVIDKISGVRNDLGQVNQVMIVAGLSGGCGSGMLINIAMLTKIALENLRPKINVFCFLPDTMEHICDLGERRSLYANGYAALKEIDYYVGLSQRKGFNDIFTATNGRSVKLDENNQLFDSVTLINGSSTRQSYRDANAKAMDVFVESAVNMLSAGNQLNGGGEQTNQSVMSFLSNRNEARRQMLRSSIEDSGRESAGWHLDDNFNYVGIGVASASIPQKVCTSYIVRRLVENIFRMNDPQASAATAGSYIADMPVIPESGARNEIYSIVGNPNELFSFRKINGAIDSATNVTTPSELEISREDLISKHFDYAREQYNIGKLRADAERTVDEAIRKKYADFREKAIAFIKRNGPRAFVYLYDGKTEENGNPVRFESEKGIERLIREALPNGIEDNRKHAETKLYKDADHKTFGFNNPKIDNAKKDLSDLISAEIKFDIDQHVYGNGAGRNAIHTGFIDKVEEFVDECRSFDKLLVELNIIYRNFSGKFDALETFRNESDSEANINIISTDEAYRWAKGSLDAVIDSISPQEAMGAIVDDYFSEEHHSDWQLVETSAGKKLNARVRFEQVIAAQIRRANNNRNVVLTINDYISHCLASGTQSIDQIVRTIIGQLQSHSDPLFKKGAEYTAIFSQAYQSVILPRSVCDGPSGNEIRAAVESTLGTSVKIFTSDVSDKIVFYKLEPSNPLYSLADLEIWENAYESSTLTMIHMNESGRGDFNPETGLEWKNYPSCRCDVDARNLPQVRRASSLEYRFLTSEFDPMFDKAIEYGIVRVERSPEGGESYKFYDISTQGWSYDTTGYDGMDDYGVPLPGAPLIDYIRRRNGAFDGIKVELFQNPMLTNPNPSILSEEAQKRAKRVIRRHVKMYVAMKRSVLKYEELFDGISTTANERLAMNAFYYLVGAGLISRNMDRNGSFELMTDDKPVSILVTTRFSQAGWPKDLLSLYENGLEYAAAFRKFREMFSTVDQLRKVERLAKNSYMKLAEEGYDDIIIANLEGLKNETAHFAEMRSDGENAFYNKLGIDRSKFLSSGVSELYETVNKNLN